MTPIEQLAKQCGAEGFADTVMLERNQLEALREAIIKDFVNGLEPSLHASRFIADDYNIERGLPLYDLSQWRDK